MTRSTSGCGTLWYNVHQMALITSGCGTLWYNVLPEHQMALITSGCGTLWYNVLPEHQMALITSGCAPSRNRPAVVGAAGLGWVREHLSSFFDCLALQRHCLAVPDTVTVLGRVRGEIEALRHELGAEAAAVPHDLRAGAEAFKPSGGDRGKNGASALEAFPCVLAAVQCLFMSVCSLPFGAVSLCSHCLPLPFHVCPLPSSAVPRVRSPSCPVLQTHAPSPTGPALASPPVSPQQQQAAGQAEHAALKRAGAAVAHRARLKR